MYFCGVKTCITYLVNIQTDTTNFLLKKSIDLAIFSIPSAFFCPNPNWWKCWRGWRTLAENRLKSLQKIQIIGAGRADNLRKIIVFAPIRNRTTCTLSSRYSFRSTNLPRKSVFNGDNGWRLSPMEWWWLKSDNAGLCVAPKQSAQTWRENIFSGYYCIIKIYCIFAASLRIFLKNPQRRCGNFVRYVP